MFNSVDTLNKGLNASWLRSETINNNIANVDTPDYKRSTVEFESYYQDALSGDGFVNKQTREKHRDFSNSDLEPVVSVDNSTTMRMDGNNVDIDTEMVNLTENVIYYNTLSNQITSEFAMLNTAITGR